VYARNRGAARQQNTVLGVGPVRRSVRRNFGQSVRLPRVEHRLQVQLVFDGPYPSKVRFRLQRRHLHDVNDDYVRRHQLLRWWRVRRQTGVRCRVHFERSVCEWQLLERRMLRRGPNRMCWIVDNSA
jgi:hypothetical protein